MKEETIEEVKDLVYWENNANENYITTPISVLKYITELKKTIKVMYTEEEISNLIAKYEFDQNNLYPEHLRFNSIEEAKNTTDEWFALNKKK